MAENHILPFAQGTDANVLSQSDYAADVQRVAGNQPGVARSNFVNKAMRQASVMASGLAQYLADRQSTDVDDTLTPAQISEMLGIATAGTFALSGEGYQVLPSGLIMQWGQATMAPATAWVSKAITFPIAFTEACFQVTASYTTTIQSASIIVYQGNYSTTGFTITMRRIDTTATYTGQASWLAFGK